EFDESSGETWWTLTPDWAEIVERRMLTRSGVVHRAPALDVALLLLRERGWEDDATARTVERVFRSTLSIDEREYERVFQFVDEDPSFIFVDEEPAQEEYYTAMEMALAPRADEAAPDGMPVAPLGVDEDDDVLT